jgi:hypothetical protein
MRPRESGKFVLAGLENGSGTKLKPISSSRSGEIVAVKVHYLGPRSREVLHKRLP